MRVIINLHEKNIVDIAGWRAKAVNINDGNECSFFEVLNSVNFSNGKKLSDIIVNKDNYINSYNIFVNGQLMPEKPDFNFKIRDNVQIHVEGKKNKKK